MDRSTPFCLSPIAPPGVFRNDSLMWCVRWHKLPGTKLSSRKFDQNTSLARKAAERGPVFITDRGQATHVLLTIEAYREITEKRESILDMLAMPSAAEIEFELRAWGPSLPSSTALEQIESWFPARTGRAGELSGRAHSTPLFPL